MVWGALAFFVAAVTGSLGYAALHGLRLWRAFRGVSRHSAEAMGRVTEAAARAEAHAVRLAGGSEQLGAATASLRESLAELAVIRAAADEPRRLVGSIRGLVPQK